jgi:hypothetical protein
MTRSFCIKRETCYTMARHGAAASLVRCMIPKSGNRFSDKIMLNQ